MLQRTGQLAKSDSIWTQADRFAGMVGGRTFAGALFATAIFSIALFALRADVVFALPPSLADAKNQDFATFWRAGAMMLEGRAAAAYDPAQFREALSPESKACFFSTPHIFSF